MSHRRCCELSPCENCSGATPVDLYSVTPNNLAGVLGTAPDTVDTSDWDEVPFVLDYQDELYRCQFGAVPAGLYSAGWVLQWQMSGSDYVLYVQFSFYVPGEVDATTVDFVKNFGTTKPDCTAAALVVLYSSKAGPYNASLSVDSVTVNAL